MIRIKDTLQGKRIWFHCAQSVKDLYEIRDFVQDNDILGIDTESTGINCYRQGWRLRTVQIGDAYDAYVIPAKHKRFVEWLIRQPMYWLGFNGPHDIRSIDQFLGYESGMVCEGEAYIPCHYADSRGRAEGGAGHGLKEQSMALLGREAGKWDQRRKEAFKEIIIPLPGEFYKSGPKKGQPKTRKAKLSEGWELIDLYHPAYVAYAAADPLLTFRVWHKRRDMVERYAELYKFDHAVQQACDRLQRRAMRLDVQYTERLSAAYMRTAQGRMDNAAVHGCDNIQSTEQVAATLLKLGAVLTAKTATKKWQVTAEVLRKISSAPYANGKLKDFVNDVLVAKQLLKRRKAYTESMLREMDMGGRVHPSINPLAARTTRMSVSGPPLQQLPTKDNEDELTWIIDDAEDEELTDATF